LTPRGWWAGHQGSAGRAVRFYENVLTTVVCAKSAREAERVRFRWRGGLLTTRWDLVVVGLGYAGLPLAVTAVQAGMRVAGLDRDAERVRALASGVCHIGDVTEAELRAATVRGFRPTVDPDCISDTEAVVICVPTPMRDGVPDLAAVIDAAETVAEHLRPGTLVVLESTSYPGTTEEVVRPLLERGGLRAGVDFHLAFSPERIDPGNHAFTLSDTPRVIGGATEACTLAAGSFYGKFVREVVRVSSPAVAEMAKLLENTYRQVNIALVNEMAVFCHELGLDLWEAIDAAATKPFGFQPFYPGPGVGGHCIPIDPNYLSFRVRTLGYPFRFVEIAQEINGRMPRFVVDRIIRILNERQLSVHGTRILLLGATYKADVADDRESPSQAVAQQLIMLGADLRYHDPYLPDWSVAGERLVRVDPLEEAVADADLVVLLQAHRDYDMVKIAAAARLVFDTRGRVKGPRVIRL